MFCFLGLHFVSVNGDYLLYFFSESRNGDVFALLGYQNRKHYN